MLNESDTASSEKRKIAMGHRVAHVLSRRRMGPVRLCEPGYTGVLVALLLGCCPFPCRPTSASVPSSACMPLIWVLLTFSTPQHTISV